MRRHYPIVLAAAVLAISSAVAIQTAHAKPPGDDHLDMYTVRAPAADAAGFARGGFDVVSLKPSGAMTEAQMVLSPAERDSLHARGYDVAVTRDKQGRSEAQRAAAQAASGYTVYRSWDEPGGIRDELHAVAKDNPQLVKAEVLGHTYGGRELLALKVTQSAPRRPRRQPPGGSLQRDPARPRVDQHRGRSAAAALLHRQMARERQDDQAAAQGHRAVVRRRREPGRLPVHVRPRTAVAEEPARQQRRRPDHRSATASTRTATSPSTGTTTTRDRRR